MDVAALFGGGLAAAAHTAKASTRAAVNTSPEPFSNIGLSLAGDVAVPTMLWLAWAQPWVFFPVLAVALAVMAALIWFCFKFVRALLRRVRRPASA
jgi:Na+/melibiose symporter-like transporter